MECQTFHGSDDVFNFNPICRGHWVVTLFDHLFSEAGCENKTAWTVELAGSAIQAFLSSLVGEQDLNVMIKCVHKTCPLGQMYAWLVGVKLIFIIILVSKIDYYAESDPQIHVVNSYNLGRAVLNLSKFAHPLYFFSYQPFCHLHKYFLKENKILFNFVQLTAWSWEWTLIQGLNKLWTCVCKNIYLSRDF